MKILHLTFHIGCANAIESILDMPEIELTTKIVTSGVDCFHYNMTYERANENWGQWKDYYNSFDAIIVTDTALLARPFLEAGYKGKLIVQFTNRFDYWDSKGDQPKIDEWYYDIMREDSKQYCFIANNGFDKFYAEQAREPFEQGITVRGVVKSTSKPYGQKFGYAIDVSKLPESISIDELMYKIKTGGLIYKETIDASLAALPVRVYNERNTYYVPTYHNDKLFGLYNICKANGLNVKTGRYRDKDELASFRAIIHIPYTWNSIALWDALSCGVPYYVPSKELLLKLLNTKNFWFQNANYCKEHLDKCEFYRPENSKFIKYFESFEGIKDIEIDYEEIYGEAKILFTINQNKWRQIL